MPIKHVGYRWQQWAAKQAGKVRERVHPSQRKKPEPSLIVGLKWNELSDEQRAHVIEEERLRYQARSVERSRLAQQEKERKRELRRERAILQSRRLALAEEDARLRREEEHLASRLRQQAEDAQWDYEKDMEDYVMGRKPIV